MVTAIIAAVVTLILLVLYKYVLNPQVIYTPDIANMTKCPDRWNYDPVSKNCVPAYKTSCLPFNPENSHLDTLTSRCNVARSCGTTWSGFCG